MNVTHRQRHEVGRFPNGKSHLFFVPLVTLRFLPLSNQFLCSFYAVMKRPPPTHF